MARGQQTVHLSGAAAGADRRGLLQKPADFAAFLSLMKAAGYEVKHGRGGSLSFRCPGQERFTRCRASTLGEGYGPEDIRAVIEGRAPLPSSRAVEPMKPGRRLNLIIDIQNRLQGKGPAYERWAKVFNLKQMAAALAYLQDNGLTEYEQLEKKGRGGHGAVSRSGRKNQDGGGRAWPPMRNSKGPR